MTPVRLWLARTDVPGDLHAPPPRSPHTAVSTYQPPWHHVKSLKLRGNSHELLNPIPLEYAS